MNQAATVVPAGGGQRSRPLRLGLAAGCVAALVPLAWLDPHQRQLGLYLSWLAAMGLYLMIWTCPSGVIRWRPSRWLVAGLIGYGLALFAGFCWAYDNWRCPAMWCNQPVWVPWTRAPTTIRCAPPAPAQTSVVRRRRAQPTTERLLHGAPRARI